MCLITSARNGEVEKVKLILANSIQLLDTQDIVGRTALIHASQKGHIEVVKILCKYNADKEVKDENGWTPLIHAAWQGFFDVVVLLLRNGTQTDIQDNDMYNALHYASIRGHKEIVNILIVSGANPDMKDNIGCTALSRAFQCKHREITKILIKGGANIEDIDNMGNSSIHIACMSQDIDVAILLASLGQDPWRLNNSQKTALSLCACKDACSTILMSWEKYVIKILLHINPNNKNSMNIYQKLLPNHLLFKKSLNFLWDNTYDDFEFS